VLAWDSRHLLVFGLRGNVYESNDQGSSWRKVDAPGSVSLLGGTLLANGGAVLVGANGTVLTRADAKSGFTAHTSKNANGETPYLTGVVQAGNGDFLLVGDKGVDPYHPQ